MMDRLVRFGIPLTAVGVGLMAAPASAGATRGSGACSMVYDAQTIWTHAPKHTFMVTAGLVIVTSEPDHQYSHLSVEDGFHNHSDHPFSCGGGGGGPKRN
jgi:hypothetical protein